MKKIIILIVVLIALSITYILVTTKDTPPTQQTSTALTYTNYTYGFTLTLPDEWNGYTRVSTTIQFGEAITLRHPLWTTENSYMDIPILVYPIAQWTTWEKNNFEGYPTAAPMGPTERGRNAKYVIATAPRYNYSFGTGFEVVEEIIKNLKAF